MPTPVLAKQFMSSGPCASWRQPAPRRSRSKTSVGPNDVGICRERRWSSRRRCAKFARQPQPAKTLTLVIIARTDARGVTSLEDAIYRSQAYLAAGADWIFPEALADRNEFSRFADEVDAPLVANMTEFGNSPLLTLDELAELGYSAVLYPVTLLRVAMKAVEAALAVLADEGTQSQLLDLMQTREELYDLLEYSDYEQRDREYFGGQNKSG